jgi:hypothetical protein
MRAAMNYKSLIFVLFFVAVPQCLAHIEADGVTFTPVVVVLTYKGTGHTNGMEVRLTETGEDAAHNFDQDPLLRNLFRNLGKPVKTDHNSTAVVWMFSRWLKSGKTYARKIQGKIIVGPVDKPPLFQSTLRDLIDDLDRAASTSGPIFVQIDLKRAE